jgi:hypothetical protein
LRCVFPSASFIHSQLSHQTRQPHDAHSTRRASSLCPLPLASVLASLSTTQVNFQETLTLQHVQTVSHAGGCFSPHGATGPVTTVVHRRHRRFQTLASQKASEPSIQNNFWVERDTTVGVKRRILMQSLSHLYTVLFLPFIFVQKGYLVMLQSTFGRCAPAHAHAIRCQLLKYIP